MDWNLISLLPSQVWESLYMTVISAAVAYIIGLPLGVILVITDKGGIRPMRAVNQVLGFVVNFFCSVPFLILMIAHFRLYASDRGQGIRFGGHDYSADYRHRLPLWREWWSLR